MQIDILTIFPSMFSPLSESILGKAREKRIITLNIHDIRDYSADKHKSVDDTPYGGGAGMVLMAEPIIKALGSLKKQNKGSRVILMSPSGKRLDQAKLEQLSKEKGLIVICGRYEGIDDRVRERFVDEEISVGDYVLSGGELPAMVLIEGISRLIPGVLGDEASKEFDSFSDGLLEGPQYTKPEDVSGMKVPKVLLSGNHKAIDGFRREQSLKKTLLNNPDLFVKAQLDGEDRKLLNDMIAGEQS
ncbi:tRNA (guanosine(37)-N1)-methyltransferase TrmD [Candidatus Margulisiibacteriota bacterium]